MNNIMLVKDDVTGIEFMLRVVHKGDMGGTFA